MSKVKSFTGKVGAKFMSFLLGGDKLHDAFYPHVEVVMEDGTTKDIYIKDDSAPVKLAEGKTRYEAIKKAKVFLEEQEKRAASKS